MGSQVNATVGQIHGPSDPASQSFTRSKMGDMYVNPADLEPPRYHVYLYTVWKSEHVVQQPPAIPYLVIPACGDEPYKLVIQIPHPFQQIERHPDKNEAIIYREVAERVAQSICNPDNPTLDQDYEVRQPLGYGVNLNQKGVFWSKNNPPTNEEVAQAHRRVEKYFASLIERARVMEITDPKGLEQLINQDFHLAAEHFGLETVWHRKLIQKVECPNCGESIKSLTLAYHVNSAGVICVIDQERAASALPSRAGEESAGGPESPNRRGRNRA